jgi:hypothetical protein
MKVLQLYPRFPDTFWSFRCALPNTRLWRRLAEEGRLLFLSFVRQGIFARYRAAYWRFLSKTLRRRPGQLGPAVTLAIMGHHFFTLARRLESEPRR